MTTSQYLYTSLGRFGLGGRALSSYSKFFGEHTIIGIWALPQKFLCPDEKPTPMSLHDSYVDIVSNLKDLYATNTPYSTDPHNK